MMEYWKRFGQTCLRLLHPPVWLAVLLTLTSAIGLVAAFAGWVPEPVTYGAYTLSAYTLSADVALTWKLWPKLWNKANQNDWVKRCRTDLPYRAEISVRLSLMINLVYALFKGWAGIRYRSIWFGVMAFYYIILVLARSSLARSLKREERGVEGWRRYIQTGWLLLIMTLALAVMGTMMIFRQDRISYPGYAIFVVAGYAFYAVVNAVRNIVRYRKLEHPVYSASKAISMTTALVSLFSMQTAMLAQFGSDEAYYKLMSCLTGGVVFLLVAGMAVYMIRHGRKMKRTAQA